MRGVDQCDHVDDKCVKEADGHGHGLMDAQCMHDEDMMEAWRFEVGAWRRSKSKKKNAVRTWRWWQVQISKRRNDKRSSSWRLEKEERGKEEEKQMELFVPLGGSSEGDPPY